MDVLNRTAIKAQARSFIEQETRWLWMFLPCLPILLLSGGLSGGITVWKSVSENGAQNTVRVGGGNGAVLLLLLPLTVAIAGYYLNHIRGFKPEWKSLYQEGFNRYGKYFAVRLVTNFCIWMWMLLLIVPGVLKALEYSQVNYIVHDNPNVTPSAARDISRRMTDGFKSELFVLGLSFLPWILLVGVTAGIASVYVYPYISTVQAMVYENLKTYAMMTNRVSPAEFGIQPVPPYTQTPYGAQPFANPQNANPYTAPQSGFTPPAAEDTFRPGDSADAPNTDFGGEPWDGQNQNF